MPWLETTEEKEKWDLLQQPFEVLREAPNAQSSRVKTLTKAQEESNLQQRDSDAQAMPALVENEAVKTRLQRLDAFQHVWDHIDGRIKEVLSAASSHTFAEIAAFVAKSHPERLDHSRQRVVPTALTIAGSINAADNADTFPSLTDFLRTKNCYAALIGSRDLSNAGSIAPALCTILKQFSGLQTDADDTQALLQWYEDETGLRRGLANSECDNAAEISSPLRKMALQTPSKAAVSEANGYASENGHKQEPGDLASPMDKLSIQTPQLHKLRPRNQQQQQQSQQLPRVKQEAAEEKLSNRQRPLVVIIESVESADPLALQDFISVVSENRSQLPITLILGLATASAALNQLLPSAVSDILDTRNFHLVQALAKLEAVYKDVLLSPEMPLLMSHQLLQRLDDHFMLHDFTVRTFQQSLKLACLVHFQASRLSELSEAFLPRSQANPQAVKDDPQDTTSSDSESEEQRSSAFVKRPTVSELLSSYDKQTAKQLSQSLGLPVRPGSVEKQLIEVQQALNDWKLALLWLNAAAKITGHPGLTSGFSARELYRDTSKGKFLSTSRGKGLFFSIQKGMQTLGLESCQSLLENLSDIASDRRLSEDLQRFLSELKECVDGLTDKAGTTFRASKKQKERAHLVSQPSSEDQENRDPGNPRVDLDAEMAKDTLTENQPIKGLQKSRSGRAAAGRKNAFAQALQVSQSQQSEKGKESAPGERLWDVFKEIQTFVDLPLSSLIGSSIFVVKNDSDCQTSTSYAPRDAIHRALYSPEVHLGGDKLGLNPAQLDISIAYHLLTEIGEDIDVGDWFSGFCMLHQPSIQASAEESPPKKAKRGRPRGSKKVLQDDPNSAGAADLKRQKALQPGKPNSPIEFDVPVEELISRFTQATNELQLMGLVKAAAKRRHGNAAQRLCFGSGMEAVLA